MYIINSGDMMYIFYALLAALTSGITTLFAKKSLNNNSNLVTFLRTIIISLINNSTGPGSSSSTGSDNFSAA